MNVHRRSSSMNIKLTLAAALAFAGVWLCAALLGGERSTGYHFGWAIAAVLLTVGGYRFFSMLAPRAKRIYGLFGFLFAAAQAMGFRLQTAGESGVVGLLLVIGVGICFAPALGFAAERLAALLSQPVRSPSQASPRKVFGISFAVILLCWLPVFLAYYPGLFAYDVSTQITEIVTGELTTRNPLLHTLYLGGFYLLGEALGNVNTGVALSVGVQMLVMAGVFAYTAAYLASLRAARGSVWLTVAFFALFPVHAMLAISCTKDTLFCGLLLLYALQLHRLSQNPALLKSWRWVAPTALAAVALCLLRNNAFFGILMCVPLGFLIVPRPLRARLIAVLLGALVLSLGLNMGLKAMFSAKGISATELVSVPSQQLSRVYALQGGALPASAEIAAYLPTVERYIPYTADPVKTFAAVKKPAKMWGFLKLWGKLGLQYPLTYLDAYLLTSQGYWWLNDTTHARIYGEGLATRQGYLLTDTKPGFGVTPQSQLPALESLLERLFSANEYQRAPILSLLFAPALYGWFTFFSLCRAIEQHRRDLALLSGFLLCYMVPLWFGACVLIRYAYPMVVCAPLLLFLPAKPASEGSVSVA